VSLYLAAGIALCAGLLPCALACLRTSAFAALAALEVAGVVSAMALLVLSAAFQRQIFADLALVLVVTSFAGALAFLAYLERR
jgi:multisubunit Na+/H+ antiporter MnhF subunit